jgi:hypothetical protein
MTEQLTLDTGEPIRNELERKYRTWLEDHREVFALFEKFSLQMLAHHRRFGMRMIQERVRWEIHTTWAPDRDGYRLNDHYPPYIARDLIKKYPGLGELIELRKVKEVVEDLSDD